MTKTTPAIVLYDRACPLCRTAMHYLEARDREQGLQLVDISDPAFNASAWHQDARAVATTLHVRDSRGRWLTGMAAIRYVYARAGLRWLTAPSAWPGLRALSDACYRRVAAKRMIISRWLGLPNTAVQRRDRLDDVGEPTPQQDRDANTRDEVRHD